MKEAQADCSAWAVRLVENFVTLCSIAFPTQGLQVIFYCATALGNWDNMVDFEQKVRLCMSRVSAGATGKVVTGLDELTQFLGHQQSLLFCKGGSSKLAF